MLFLSLFIVLTVLSQILLKKSSIEVVNNVKSKYLLGMIKNPKVLLAYLISALNIFIWVIVLSKMSLSTAFLFTSSIYVIMVFVDKFLFGEKLEVNKLLGVCCIVLGLLMSLL